nr:M28 family peptidase [Aquimarina sp. RZ0]
MATQVGQTNPYDIYIVCAHCDSLTDYGADDNATSTSAILEIARILSQYCIENTIIYALWDQEEVGLIGSKNYASNGDNIVGVINLDMIKIKMMMLEFMLGI